MLVGYFMWKADSSPGSGTEADSPTAFSPGSDNVPKGDDQPSKSRIAWVAKALPSLARFPMVPANALSDVSGFRRWAERYLSSTADQQAVMVEEGVDLAQKHRAALKSMLKTDPRAALEQAVPMAMRQRLPTEVKKFLENRVSAQANLDVQSVCEEANHVKGESCLRRYLTIDSSEYRTWLYGQRTRLNTTPSVTVNGISIDRDLAVSDSPVRMLEVGEVPDASKELVMLDATTGEEQKVIPAEPGQLPVITAETPAIEVGDKIIFLEDGAQAQQIAEEIMQEELWMAEGASGGANMHNGLTPIAAGGENSSGTRKLLYVRLAFPDRRNESQSEAQAYANLKVLSDYFVEQSFGKVTFVSTVTPVVTLPRTEAWYIDDYNTNGSTGPINSDAREAARAAGFPPEEYQHFVAIYSGGPGFFGGVAGVGGSGVLLRSTSTNTLKHEIGHNLGARHSNSLDTGGASVIGPGVNVEYGHIKDTMGNSSSGGHFNSSLKEQMKWMLPENYHTVTQSGIYRIYQIDQVNQRPANSYALKVAKDAERDYWIELKQMFPTNPWWMSGASINWNPWGYDGATLMMGSDGTQLLDMTPGTPDLMEDSPLVIGRTFSDTEAGVHITPIGKGGTTPESLDVVVNVGTFPGNRSPSLSLGTSSFNPSTGMPVTLTASGSDPDNDALAYYWEFGDIVSGYNGVTFSTNNAQVQSKSYAANGRYVVRCTVSDMKGGSTTQMLTLTVGASSTFTVSGMVMEGGFPVKDVLVSNGSTGSALRYAFTDSTGAYTVTNLASGSVTLSASKAGYVLTPGFSNPMTVNQNLTGKNFTAVVGTRVSISAPDATADESGDTATFRISRTGSTASPLVVHTDISGTATVTSDYSLSPAPNTQWPPLEAFTIPEGSAFLDVTITPVDDETQEGPETLVMSTVNGGSDYLTTGNQTATVTLNDNDTTLPKLSLSVTTPETTEGNATPAVITVSRTGSTAASLTAAFTLDTTANTGYTGYATNGTDYTSIGSSVVIPAGMSEKAINIVPSNDAAVEGVELVKLTLSSNAAYVLPSPTPVAIVKINDDDISTISVAATDSSAIESGGMGIFTFTRSGATTAAATVYYTLTGTALGGVDYRALPGLVTFAAGSATAAVEVAPIQDDDGEPTQTVVLQISGSAKYQVSGSGSAVVDILDDDDLPVVTVNTTNSQAAEGASPATGVFLLTSTGTGSDITMYYTLSGTAKSGEDFNPVSGSATTLRTGSRTVVITPVNDAIPEDAETVVLTISPRSNYQVGLESSASLTIRDDDAVNMVSVSSTTTVASETTAGKFYFNRRSSSIDPVTVYFSVGGTATPGDDYAAMPASVTIPANQTGVYVTVTPVDDTLAEGMETVSVTLLPDPSPTKNYGIEVGSATFNLTDDDAAALTSTFSFAVTDLTRDEGTGNVEIAVTRSGDTTGPASVEYGTLGGYAQGNGIDYTLPTGRLEFSAGETSKTFPVALVDDALSEDIDFIILQLRNATGATVPAPTSQCTLIILDNEPRLAIEATKPFGFESGAPFEFTVMRYGDTSKALVVPLTFGGTAVQNSDYFNTLPNPNSVVIPAGQSSVSTSFTPENTGGTEATETVIVSLTAFSQAVSSGQASATMSIDDAQTSNAPYLKIVSPKTTTPAIPDGVGLKLESIVADDGPAVSLTVAWSKVSGPGTVTFSAESQQNTDANFSSPGTYVLRLTASDGSMSATSDLTITVGAPSLPWTNLAVGELTQPGSAMEQNGVHLINAVGASLTTTEADNFFMRSRRLTGNGEIRARVRHISYTSASAHVGVMLREDTGISAMSAAMVLEPQVGNSVRFLFRTGTGAKTGNTIVDGIIPAWWVRVVRSGNNFSAYDSPDGLTWTQRSSTRTILMGTDILAGLCVSSVHPTRLNTSIFDNVTIIGTPENTAPAVLAGAGGSGHINTPVALDGTITDDALPMTPGTTAASWTQVSGPGQVTFANASAVDTTATFNMVGSYVLRLAADDGQVRTFDDVVYTINQIPRVTILASDATAAENGASTGTFTVSRDGDLTEPLTVHFSVSGTAMEGMDYTSIGAQIVIPANAASGSINVAPLVDGLSESDETVTVTLASGPGYELGSPLSAMVTLQDLPVDAWRYQEFGAEANNPAVAGDTADPNGNGFSNLVEYAMVLDPTATDGLGQPVAKKTNTHFEITYTRRINDPTVLLRLEWSLNLTPVSWFSAGFSELATPRDAETETVTVSLPITASDGRRFFRFKVTRP